MADSYVRQIKPNKGHLNLMSFVFRHADRANLLTSANAALGVISIAFALAGSPIAAATLIVATASLDHLDGWVARTYCGDDKDARSFGGHLGTLADVVDFSLAPTVLLFTISGISCGTTVIATFFVLTGLYRLAHFEMVGAEGGRRYVGLPTTYAAYLL